jgi:hypothetical protein
MIDPRTQHNFGFPSIWGNVVLTFSELETFRRSLQKNLEVPKLGEFGYSLFEMPESQDWINDLAVIQNRLIELGVTEENIDQLRETIVNIHMIPFIKIENFFPKDGDTKEISALLGTIGDRATIVVCDSMDPHVDVEWFTTIGVLDGDADYSIYPIVPEGWNDQYRPKLGDSDPIIINAKEGDLIVTGPIGLETGLAKPRKVNAPHGVKSNGVRYMSYGKSHFVSPRDRIAPTIGE